MDYGSVYIKMCEKAEEIQKLTPEPDEQDWYSDNGLVWLPRQDQLQEMWVKHSGMKLPDYLPEFHYFAKDDVPGQFSSMEQLWLAFVLKEQYLKIWDGGSWVEKKVEVANA